MQGWQAKNVYIFIHNTSFIHCLPIFENAIGCSIILCTFESSSKCALGKYIKPLSEVNLGNRPLDNPEFIYELQFI